MKRKAKSKKNKVDRILLATTLILVVFGVVMVFSSSGPYAKVRYNNYYFFFSRQWKFALVGLVLMFITSRIDYHRYRKYSILIWIASLVLCALVFSPLGLELNNAKRWLLFKAGERSFTIMPSDALKPAAILMLAAWLDYNEKDANSIFRGMLPTFLLIGISVVLIYKQPDFSTSLVLALSLVFMYIVSGVKLSLFLIPLPAVVVLGSRAFLGPENAYRRERLIAFLDPLANKQDAGWQLVQSLYAVSSGALFGVGLGKSAQKFTYLSEAHNDFIFAIISEELGFVGAVGVIILFLIFIARGVQIAYLCKDRFGMLLAVGITAVIGLQAFVNIGTALGVGPPTGIALPFISYGGNSLIFMMGMTGVLLNISRNREERRKR